MLYKIVEEINGLEASLGREFMNTFQSSHFVQLFNFKKRNPQGLLVFFSSQTGRSKHSGDIQLHFGKRKGNNVVNCEDVQNPKGERDGLLQVETEP